MKAAGSRNLKQLGAGSATIILAILLLLLVAVTAYLLVTYYSQNSALEALERQLSTTQYDLERANSSLEQVEQDKQAANRERNSLRKRLLDLQTTGDDRLKALQQRIEEYGQQQRKAEDALKQQKARLDECDGLAAKLEEADNQVKTLTALGPDFEQCKQDLAESAKALQALKEEGSPSQATSNELASLNQRLESCQKQLAQAGSEQKPETAAPGTDSNSSLAKTSLPDASLAAQIADLKAELDTCRTEKTADATPAADQENAKVADLEKQIAQLQQDLASREKELQADVESADKENASKLADMENQLAGLTKQLGQCRTDLAEAQGQDSQKEVAEVKTTYESLIHDLKQEISDKEVTIEQFKDKVKIQIVGQVLFPSGSTHITAKGKEVLQKFQNTLSELKNKQIYVVGHTDDVDIKAAFSYWMASNWELSAKRAASVVRYLIKNAGVAPESLAAVGRSYYDPVGSNDTAEGRAQNRRVEIVVSNDRLLK